MAPRQTVRRLLVAAPALALALAVTACSPPNEQPADPDAPYTLPSYTDEPGSATPEAEPTAADEQATVGEQATADEQATSGVEGEPATAVPGQEQPAAEQGVPTAPPAQPAP